MATLKPPSATARSSSSSSTPTGPPKAPLKADPTATISDTVIFHGKHPVTIGAGTVIHPRVRFYTYEGPIVIGDGCIIGEKTIIGATPSSASSSSSIETPTRLSYFVTIGPQCTIKPGAHIHSSSAVEALCTLNRHTDIGSHSKICSGCELPERGSVPEWTVVWGSGIGQRRRRAREAKTPGPAVTVAAQVAQIPAPGPAPSGKVIEDARLMVLQKEREILGRMLVPTGPKKR
ncbi:hypothetical protein N7533_009054 [Penicillium manginii]|jgi:carbonic anhydrase/acetyltransferase-like protein (isoleucine patch superfamily)|uniref:uncharacterized protein n=1 Tax=Penicillium manginii TaxID=203109 RepID=UPI0025496E9E|nr:uncharacterized protein N7533_009054 [Penicillium manginii]KAJ5744184.1 hypothetical protein N7533_009054 [Penicillium manginii]